MKTMSKMNARLGAVLAGLALLLAGLPVQAGTITYFHNDLAGSPMVATNQDGQVIWRESYRPYGERLVNSAAASGNAVWFTSRRQDAESGLVYMGARHYDPVAGRFVSMDPVGFDEGNIHSFNRYAYANNNPYRYVDPDGRSPVLLLRLFGGGAIGGTAGAAADAVSQYAAFGSVDWGMAAQSNAAQEGAAAGALSFLPAGTPAGLGIKSIGGEAAKGAGIVAKDGTAITGLSKHGVDRVIGDGAKRAGTRPEAIIEAVKNPTTINEGVDNLGRTYKVYASENARVVINPETGKIISTNPLSREGAHLP